MHRSEPLLEIPSELNFPPETGVAELAAKHIVRHGSIRVFLVDGIDPLEAIPMEAFRTTPKLHKQRWPQIQASLAKQREASRRSLRGSRTS